ncbi:MlaC/ttg2D family ABC transporter substrate-binding protein [Pseudomaricurvus sp.]|uniref:MlaC/ttg2D family ABC transporter substrate-binding protein n=1 Tax=Pseudomaricurvus sp. TaxID=2004510 RepID=UPI003F6C5369
MGQQVMCKPQTIHKRVVALFVSVFFSVLWAQAQAQGSSQANSSENYPADGPYALVEQVTRDILNVVEDQKDLLEQDPEAFYSSVGEVLSPVVAFDYIARGVMGSYAKQASPEQRKRFSKVFRDNLISTYAKGMAVYGQQKIVLVEPDQPVGEQRKVSVVQKVQTEEAEHTVNYTMGKSKLDDSWKLLNVTINGINLGVTFRSQFSQAMRKDGDLDQVIDGWSAQGAVKG